MSSHRFFFTSESVTEGHPDKLCDKVSDTILDACLKADPESKVACEACAKTGFVIVFGEISTKAKLDYQKLVRNAIIDIGYNSSDVCFDGNTCAVQVSIAEQSDDIAHIVHLDKKQKEDLGAGDQGIMFGYATDETPELMPLTHVLAHRLAMKLTEVRKSGKLPYLAPDGKTQVTIEYERKGGEIKPIHIHTVLISTMHKADVSLEKLREDVKKEVILPVLPKELVNDKTIMYINPVGKFVIGGPMGDAGLTGRKIIVDGYGGWGAHGGGAFSGKDPTKVDRSACYAARWVAKSIVNAKLAKRVLVQLSYAIGLSEPLSIYVDSYGTGDDEKILEVVKSNFDLRPYSIIKELDLLRPIYAQTAAYGHFGRDDIQVPWEKPKALKL